MNTYKLTAKDVKELKAASLNDLIRECLGTLLVGDKK
jgi:hypothetical protein